jgi:hypothetical protein
MRDDNERENILVKGFHDSEHSYNDVHSTVPLVPEFIQFLHCTINVTFQARSNDSLNCNWMRLVANFEDIVTRYEAKSRVSRLKVIDCLTHVAFAGKYKCS